MRTTISLIIAAVLSGCGSRPLPEPADEYSVEAMGTLNAADAGVIARAARRALQNAIDDPDSLDVLSARCVDGDVMLGDYEDEYGWAARMRYRSRNSAGALQVFNATVELVPLVKREPNDHSGPVLPIAAAITHDPPQPAIDFRARR